MSEDLDKRLRAALRPVDPGERFAAQVMARIAAERTAAPAEAGAAPAEAGAAPRDARTSPPHQFRLAWLPAALAASVLAVIVVRHERELRREEGLAARAQVIEALRLTSGKLDLAFQLVSGPPARDAPAPGPS